MSFFSLYFLYSKYTAALEASTQAFSAKAQAALSQSIHALQIERGLSSGYVSCKHPDGKTSALLRSRRDTDAALETLQHLMHIHSREKRNLESLLKHYNEPHSRRLDALLGRLEAMRRSVTTRSGDFEGVIGYYSSIIRELFDMYFGLVWMTRSDLTLGNDILLLEQVKENAGLERAYIYHQLLENNYRLEEIVRTRDLIDKQKKLGNSFQQKLTDRDRQRYHQTVRPELTAAIAHFRKRFFCYALSAEDADRWFAATTARIDAMEAYIRDTVDGYMERKNAFAQKATRDFYLFLTLGILAFGAFVLLVYYLDRMLAREERMKRDLLIASFAFDAHEAMVVTDNLGTILRVNKAFSRITGYTAEEAIGQNPSVLKSGRHDEAFYQKMWRDLAQKGHWSGEIYNRRKSGEIYPEHLSITAIKDDEGLITHYISHFVDISDLKEAEEEARHQAMHDFLTGLPNRKAMMEKLGEELARSRRHGFVNALLFIDLDDFKRLNDSSGHAAGDQLLIEVATRLKQSVREEDYVARISGDEFCVILVEVAEDYEQAAERTAQVVDKILASLGEPFAIDTVIAHIGASIGVRLFPESDDDAQKIIMQADASMYKAKESGKNRYVFFDEKIQARCNELMHFQSEIHRALERNEVVFYLQPKVSFKTGQIVGAELMVRWEHPQRGLLFPGDFLEVFESMSMMPKLTEMALDTACRLVRDMERFTGALSVNVTAYELRSQHFLTKVEETIRRYGIDPACIELEILENDLIEDFDAVIENMNRLRAFGVRFSIDDFGVGYSSINYLSKLPVDTLKIDRKFVLGLEDNRTRETIRVITRFSRVYELKTVIEGVETREELEILSRLGLDAYQGFYFSRAVDAEAFCALVKASAEDESPES